ncbi:hypothetical protein B0H13DRAFT_2280998 [Mycena leptocephala]|nr:hypothetical protein B0H13DRAFT_2280998 [Mycena leptocephala]
MISALQTGCDINFSKIKVKYKERIYKDREHKSKNTAAGQPHRERRFGFYAPYAEQVEIAWMYSPLNYIEDQWESGFPRSPYAEQVEIAWMYSPLNYKDIEDQWESGFPRSMRKRLAQHVHRSPLDLPPKLRQAPNQRKILYIDAGPARTAPPNPCCSSESRKGSAEQEYLCRTGTRVSDADIFFNVVLPPPSDEAKLVIASRRRL